MNPPTNDDRKSAPKERTSKAVSLTSEVATWAEEKAKAENRSFSNFIETLLLKKREEMKQPA